MNFHEAEMGFLGWLVIWIVVMFAWSVLKKKDGKGDQPKNDTQN